MGLSERLLVGLSAESSPLPPQVSPGHVRGLRRSQLVDLVRRIGGEEAERLQVRERELELRELAALEQLAELESELQVAQQRIEELEQSQSNTARYELPRLADLIVDEQARSEALVAEVAALKAERDELAARVAELEAGTANASADADLEAAAAVFAEGAESPEEEKARQEVLSATAEFFGEGSELLEDAEVQAILAEAGLGEDSSPAARAEALLGADASDELSQAAQALLGAALTDPESSDDSPDDTTRNFLKAGALIEGDVSADPGEVTDRERATDRVRVSDLERALISASSEAAASTRRSEELSERLAVLERERGELQGQIQRLRDSLAAAQSQAIEPLRASHQTQRLTSPLVGRPELPGIVTDDAGQVDLDHLLGAYVKAEERAARIDILEEVVWRLEAGKPSSEAWRRALEQVRRACAHEQAAREEATRALNSSETQRVALEARLRSSEDASGQAQLELQTLMARYSSLEEALERSRHELEAGRRALADAREEADSAGQAWSQAEDELGEVEPAALGRATEALRSELAEDLVEIQAAYEELVAAHDQLREAQRETLEEIETLNEEQSELEVELEQADLEVQRLELALVAAGLPLPAQIDPGPVELGLDSPAPEVASSADAAADAIVGYLEGAAGPAPAPEIVHPASALSPAGLQPEIVLPSEPPSESPTDLFDAPPLSEGDRDGEVTRLREQLEEQREAAENYQRARRAFHEAQAQRDEALGETARLRRHLAESRQAEAAWVWSAEANEAALEARLTAAEALRERLAAVSATEAQDPAQAEALDEASAFLEASRSLEGQVELFAGLDPDEARAALAQSEAALAELESVLLQLGAGEGASDLVGVPEAGGLQERVTQLELELAAARGRASGAQDVAAGLRDRLREEHQQREALGEELEEARSRAEAIRSELNALRERSTSGEPEAAAALASAQAELGEARARLSQLEQGEHEAAAARDLLRDEVREAAEARRTAEADLQRALAERDLARSQTASAPDPEAESEGELLEAERALHEVFQAELGGALGELELTQAELEATQSDLEAAEAELELLRTELGLAQARVIAAQESSQSAAREQAAQDAAAEAAIQETRVLDSQADLCLALAERDAAQSALALREEEMATQAQALAERTQALEERNHELEAERTQAKEQVKALGAALSESAALREQVAALEARLERAEGAADETTAALQQDLEAAQERIEDAEESLSAARANAKALREEFDASQTDRASAERAAAVSLAELEASRAEREAAQAEHEAALAETARAKRQAESDLVSRLQTELSESQERVASLEDANARARAEQARLETLLETHAAVQTGLEARAREAEARARQVQGQAQEAQQEVAKLEAVLTAQRSVQEGLERRLQEREQDAESLVAAATAAGRIEALELALTAERSRSEDLQANARASESELDDLRSQMSHAVSARATTEVEAESLRADLARTEQERDEAEGTVARLLAEIANQAAADPITDRLEHPDLPESEAVSAARVGTEDSSEELTRAREELEDLRLLLSEQEQLSFAMRAEIVELQALQAEGRIRGDEDEEADEGTAAPVSDLEAAVAALEEELAARDKRCTRLESERARLSEEIYDLGRLLESECWRGLATHRDLVRAHQRLRLMEEGGATAAGPTQEGSAAKVLAEARRSLVAEGPPDDEGDDELRQQAVAWLLTQAPQRSDALAESSELLPEIEEQLREESEALLHMRQEFRGRRQGLLEDLLTAERAVRHATEVGVQTGELDRRARKATSRLGDFDAHLEVELRAREEARGMLEDLRLWLLWELGEHGASKVGESDPGEDRVEALELQQSVADLERRLAEEERQRRQLERDAMQAMEELEEDRQRLERDLQQLVEAHLRDSAEDEVERTEAERAQAEAVERIDELEGALASQRQVDSDGEQLQRQAERIAALSWDLESRESLVHWLMQELDPRVRGERDEALVNCAEAVRGSPPVEGVDPDELIHWLETPGGVPANGNALWVASADPAT